MKYNLTKFSNLELIKYKQELENNISLVIEEVEELVDVVIAIREELKQRLEDLEYLCLEAEDDRLDERWEQTYIN